jgi:hypothetical protein
MCVYVYVYACLCVCLLIVWHLFWFSCNRIGTFKALVRGQTKDGLRLRESTLRVFASEGSEVSKVGFSFSGLWQPDSLRFHHHIT